MNPHQFETTCSVCGGPGVATSRGLTAEWTGGVVAHESITTCLHYLEKKRNAAEKVKEDKPAQDRAKFDADDEYMFEQLEEHDGH